VLLFRGANLELVLSALMLHHLPAPTKHQGLAEIARALKSCGCLINADFTRTQGRSGQAILFHAGGNRLEDLIPLVWYAGHDYLETEAVAPAQHSALQEQPYSRRTRTTSRVPQSPHE
jgi:hypothetical protein